MPLAQLLLSAALVAANGLFVVAEFALARVRPTQVAEWEREGRWGASSVRHALEHLDEYLAACQLGITMASLGLGAIGERALHDLLAPVLGGAARVGSVGLASALAFALITMIHVVAGELAPKSVAIARTERAALTVTPVVRAFYGVTRPLVELFNGLGSLLLKPFGLPPAREVGHAPPTEDELHELLREAADHGLIDTDEQLLSHNALTVDDLRVRQIMIPRRKLRYATTDMDLARVVQRIREAGVPRLPLCEPEGGLDTPVGLLHANELLTALADRAEVSSLVSLARPIDRVPDAMLVDELLYDMRRRGQELVLIVDEHETTVGGVALETILDVIVGWPADGSDRALASRDDGGALVVPGSAFVYAVARELGVTLPDPHHATIGGLVVERLGRVPEVGDVVVLDGLRLEVAEVRGEHVERLRILPVSPTAISAREGRAGT
jgi:CBS domain containing-hemolysin-like protein